MDCASIKVVVVYLVCCSMRATCNVKQAYIQTTYIIFSYLYSGGTYISLQKSLKQIKMSLIASRTGTKPDRVL